MDLICKLFIEGIWQNTFTSYSMRFRERNQIWPTTNTHLFTCTHTNTNFITRYYHRNNASLRKYFASTLNEKLLKQKSMIECAFDRHSRGQIWISDKTEYGFNENGEKQILFQFCAEWIPNRKLETVRWSALKDIFILNVTWKLYNNKVIYFQFFSKMA